MWLYFLVEGCDQSEHFFLTLPRLWNGLIFSSPFFFFSCDKALLSFDLILDRPQKNVFFIYDMFLMLIFNIFQYISYEPSYHQKLDRSKGAASTGKIKNVFCLTLMIKKTFCRIIDPNS